MVKTFKIRLNSKIAYDTMMALALCSQTLVLYVIAFMNKVSILAVFTPFIMPLVYGTLAIIAFKSDTIKWIKIRDVIFIFICALAFVYTYYRYPDNWKYIKDNLQTWILPCIPYFFLGLCFRADNESFEKISKFSCVAIVAAVFYAGYFQKSGRNFTADNMSASYAIMLNVMIVVNYAFRQRKMIPTLLAICGYIYVIALGTRGPLVIILVYTALEMWRHSRLNTRTKVGFTVFLSLGIVMVLESNVYISLLTIFGEFLTRIGLSNRITEYMRLNRLISDSSGRDTLFTILVEQLKTRPLTGYGIYGEWQFINYSAHNLYLEVLFEFGIIAGAIIIFYYLYTYIKAIYRNSNELSVEWLLIWGCAVFVRGLFGCTIFSTSVFFLLGYMIRVNRERHFGYILSNGNNDELSPS